MEKSVMLWIDDLYNGPVDGFMLHKGEGFYFALRNAAGWTGMTDADYESLSPEEKQRALGGPGRWFVDVAPNYSLHRLEPDEEREEIEHRNDRLDHTLPLHPFRKVDLWKKYRLGHLTPIHTVVGTDVRYATAQEVSDYVTRYMAKHQ